jgi:uncharacterized GH25 family protein
VVVTQEVPSIKQKHVNMQERSRRFLNQTQGGWTGWNGVGKAAKEYSPENRKY